MQIVAIDPYGLHDVVYRYFYTLAEEGRESFANLRALYYGVVGGLAAPPDDSVVIQERMRKGRRYFVHFAVLRKTSLILRLGKTVRKLRGRLVCLLPGKHACSRNPVMQLLS